MAIQTIEQGQGLSGLLGQSLGTGLSAGLQGLAESKMQQLQAQHARKQLEPLFGPQISALLQSLPPEVQKSALQNIGPLLQLKEQLGGGAAQQDQPFSPQSLNPDQKAQIRAHLSTVKNLTPEQMAKAEQLLGPVQQPDEQEAQAQQAPEISHEESPSNTANLLEDIFTPQSEKRAKQDLAIKEKTLALRGQADEREEKKFELKKEESISKLHDKISAAKDEAKSRLEDLERMEELDKEGKYDSTAYLTFLEKAGLDIPALMSPGSEEFNKIAANFIRDAKNYFGGRISNFEVEQFLKTIPSLMQSPEGRKRVISNLKRINRMAVAEYDAYKEARKANKNASPLELSEDIDERLEKKRDAIAAQFKEDLAREVPKGESKALIAAAAGAGNVLGKAGKLAKAGLGAYTGMKTGQALGGLLGPAGRAIGAGVGGIGGGLGGLFGLL